MFIDGDVVNVLLIFLNKIFGESWVKSQSVAACTALRTGMLALPFGTGGQ